LRRSGSSAEQDWKPEASFGQRVSPELDSCAYMAVYCSSRREHARHLAHLRDPYAQSQRFSCRDKRAPSCSERHPLGNADW